MHPPAQSLPVINLLQRRHGVWNVNDHVHLSRLKHGQDVGFTFDQWLVDQAAGNPVLGQIPEETWKRFKQPGLDESCQQQSEDDYCDVIHRKCMRVHHAFLHVSVDFFLRSTNNIIAPWMTTGRRTFHFWAGIISGSDINELCGKCLPFQ